MNPNHGEGNSTPPGGFKASDINWEMWGGKIESEVQSIVRDMKKLTTLLESKYVTKEDFGPVRAIVYGLVALILVGFFGVLIAGAYRQPTTAAPPVTPQIIYSLPPNYQQPQGYHSPPPTPASPAGTPQPTTP